MNTVDSPGLIYHPRNRTYLLCNFVDPGYGAARIAFLAEIQRRSQHLRNKTQSKNRVTSRLV